MSQTKQARSIPEKTADGGCIDATCQTHSAGIKCKGHMTAMHRDACPICTPVSPPEPVAPLDLLRLARAEFGRYREYASAGAVEMFSSAALARELVAEAIDRMEQDA